MLERCPTCRRETPCPTCGDSGDVSFLAPVQEQIVLGKRASWILHMLRRSYAAEGKAVATSEAEDIIRRVDELVAATKELGIH